MDTKKYCIFAPMKLNMKLINWMLAGIALGLMLICAATILMPMEFTKKQHEREVVVKQRLLQIRKAQAQYRKVHGYFAASLQALVGEKLIADSITVIPFSNNKKFDLTVSSAVLKSGKSEPVMECSATYDDYLYGLDENEIGNLNEQAAEQGQYAGLKIGDINIPNDNAGNWE